MKLNVVPGRVVVKKHEAKLKGSILLPPARNKLYEIGEVVEVGRLTGYGPEGKNSTLESYNTGDLVLFQLPQSFAAMATYKIQGVLQCFLHVDDIIGHLNSDTIELANFVIAGRYLLLQPTVRQESVIITPDAAEEATKDMLHFSVLQQGKDVKEKFFKGQEVFPDKGRVNPISIDKQDFVFVDQQSIFGCLGGD